MPPFLRGHFLFNSCTVNIKFTVNHETLTPRSAKPVLQQAERGAGSEAVDMLFLIIFF